MRYYLSGDDSSYAVEEAVAPPPLPPGPPVKAGLVRAPSYFSQNPSVRVPQIISYGGKPQAIPALTKQDRQLDELGEKYFDLKTNLMVGNFDSKTPKREVIAQFAYPGEVSAPLTPGGSVPRTPETEYQTIQKPPIIFGAAKQLRKILESSQYHIKKYGRSDVAKIAEKLVLQLAKQNNLTDLEKLLLKSIVDHEINYKDQETSELIKIDSDYGIYYDKLNTKVNNDPSLKKILISSRYKEKSFSEKIFNDMRNLLYGREFDKLDLEVKQKKELVEQKYANKIIEDIEQLIPEYEKHQQELTKIVQQDIQRRTAQPPFSYRIKEDNPDLHLEHQLVMVSKILVLKPSLEEFKKYMATDVKEIFKSALGTLEEYKKVDRFRFNYYKDYYDILIKLKKFWD